MYLLKLKNLVFVLPFACIFLLLCMPNSIKQLITIDFFGLSFVLISFIIIPYIFFSFKGNKLNNLFKLVLIYFILILIGVFSVEDYYLQRFIISSLFFVPFIIIESIKWDFEKIKILKLLSLFTFAFLSFQVIFSSLGILKFNSSQVSEIGEYSRVGTTAGVATFTAPVLLILFGILDIFVKKKYNKMVLFGVLCIDIFLLGTRSAMIILVFYILIIAIFKMDLKYKIISVCLFLFLGPIANSRYKILETIELRNQNAKNYSEGDITSGRVKRWQVVIDKIKQNPEGLLTGFGGGESPYYNRYLKTDLQPTTSPHNVYLAMLFEHGVFALIVFILILFNLSRRVFKAKSKVKYIFIFTILVTFNTEVIPLSGVFSSLFFMLFTLLDKEKQLKMLYFKNR